MINVTGGKDGEKVSVELIGSKDEVVREARYFSAVRRSVRKCEKPGFQNSITRCPENQCLK